MAKTIARKGDEVQREPTLSPKDAMAIRDCQVQHLSIMNRLLQFRSDAAQLSQQGMAVKSELDRLIAQAEKTAGNKFTLDPNTLKFSCKPQRPSGK